VLLDSGTYSNTIGSSDPGMLTVISGNVGNGIEMRGTHGNTVINSYVGTGFDKVTARGNGANGILIADDSYNNFIGSTSAAPANVIANNATNGVSVTSGTGNAILGNSIYGNPLPGINLAAGANLNQASPVLTSANTVAATLEITGTLTSTPRKTYVIEFFANDVSEAAGRYFLGSLEVTTSSTGEAAFTYSGPLGPVNADYITATATDSANNTSEFSADIS
jgi:hypothetical protein